MSRVAVVRFDGDIPRRGIEKAGPYRAMLKAGFEALGKKDFFSKKRFSQPGLFKHRQFSTDESPARVIGMKTNCLARRFNSTPVALVDAITDLFVEGGVDVNNLVVWERSNEELKSAGFELNASIVGRRCLGTDTNGLGYDREFWNSGDVNSMVSKVLTDVIDYSINLPILKDHWLAGMSGGLKNMYGAIHNPNKFHDNNCSPFCAHINNLEPIRSKFGCSILDAVRVQYNGGPGWASSYLSYYGGLIISEDPVACDAVGLTVLEHIRKENGQDSLETVGRPVKYLEVAKDLGLGESDVKKIDLKVVSVNESGRITDGDLF